MQQVIDLIPFLDLAIAAIVAFAMYLGWKHGLPRLLMAVGAVYSGFLLSSIYYHLFAVMLANVLKVRPTFTTDLVAFLVLFALASGLMLLLLVNLFGHWEIKGRAVIFGKIGGLLAGMVAAAFAVTVVVTVMRSPIVSYDTKVNDAVNLSVVQAFNNGYNRSLLAPNLAKTAPLLLKSVAPMLPPDMKEKGAVPLLQSLATQDVSARK